MGPQRRLLRDSLLWMLSITSLSLQSVSPMLLSVFLSPISTILRVLVKLSAVPSNKELCALVMLLDSLQLVLPTRRCFPSNNTRRFSILLDLVTLLVCLSRVLERMRRFLLEILFTSKRKATSSQSTLSVVLWQFRSTLVCLNLDIAQLFSLVLPR